MSNILSYNNKTTGESWISLTAQYGADEINMISDPNAGLADTPRTAIPSPFANMDLVKNAFRRLSMDADLIGEAMDEKLVSNALDIAQLFFSYGELEERLHIVEWNRATALAMLQDEPQHKLLADTMAMFLEQDKEAFNFDIMDKLYFLVYGNKVLGSTSPVTLFMATPNAKPQTVDIPVEQNEMAFDSWRPLHQRTPKFVAMLYALFTAYPQLKKRCGEVNAYLIASLPKLPKQLRDQILTEIGNPASLDIEGADKARNYLNANYSPIEGGAQILGVPLYCSRQEDVVEAIAKSDFLMIPTRKPEGERIPLVLQNHLNAPSTDPFRYVTGYWDDTTIITLDDCRLSPDKRVLPATNHQYPWLTAEDFFQPALMKLDYTMDANCYFNGNLSAGSRDTDNNDFVLPLKPLFFKYFDVADLWGTVAGRPRFEMVHTRIGQGETVKAILRIPVQKQGHFITLERTYTNANGVDMRYDVSNDCGHFITVPFALALFPFVRTESAQLYNVQLIDRALGMLDNHSLSLSFFRNGVAEALAEDVVTCRNRTMKKERRVGSHYYRVASHFDHIGVCLTDEQGNQIVQGVVCPKWPLYVPGHDAYTFAVDFGTTNTHVECKRGDGMPEPLAISYAAVERLVATLYNGTHNVYDNIMKQEFLPKEIGADYGFPQRTVLSESERMDAENIDSIVSLADANIPFIYEKESTGYGNRIVPNLKWGTDGATTQGAEMAVRKRIQAYLTEIAQLMRAKVLLGGGDIARTRLVWFYPLSMKVGNINTLARLWERTFADVFGITDVQHNIMQMPESVAPYYYYRCSSNYRGAASTVASIDIGGGSSDVVVYEANASQPALLTSFRFAANVLFGDGFSQVPHGDTNPMTVKYVDYFRRIFNSDDDKYGELNGILDDITAKRKSEEINAFLFSVISNKAVGGNDVFSYNARLSEDGRFKIVFIYFYTAIVYYVACLMHHRNLDMPRCLMFSGTGSKVLDIVGSQRDLDLLTRAVFEKVYGRSYGSDGFSVVMERREPKQLTCRGALMQVGNPAGEGVRDVETLNNMLDTFDSKVKVIWSTIDKERLVYDDMESQDVREQIVANVRKFNDFFNALCDEIHVVDRFLVDNTALQNFRQLVGLDLEHHLVSGWNYQNGNRNDRNGNDPIEDVPFFYPIKGSIRDNLIEKI